MSLARSIPTRLGKRRSGKREPKEKLNERGKNVAKRAQSKLPQSSKAKRSRKKQKLAQKKKDPPPKPPPHNYNADANATRQLDEERNKTARSKVKEMLSNTFFIPNHDDIELLCDALSLCGLSEDEISQKPLAYYEQRVRRVGTRQCRFWRGN